jgi:hypothetical protein
MTGIASFVGLSLVGSSVASAATNSTSLAERLATKFNLKKEDVQSEIETFGKEKHAERIAEVQTKIDEAVASGKLTQAQADLWKKIQDYRQANKPTEEDMVSLKDLSSEEREAKKAEMEQAMATALGTTTEDINNLHTALKDAGINGFGGKHMGGSGHGMRGGMMD